jgi:hypothetical protein
MGLSALLEGLLCHYFTFYHLTLITFVESRYCKFLLDHLAAFSHIILLNIVIADKKQLRFVRKFQFFNFLFTYFYLYTVRNINSMYDERQMGPIPDLWVLVTSVHHHSHYT